jgi:glycosyltransferase involved in cell wall biosynthesis
MAANAPLLVFADDWGRHPSSCQHLIRRLAPERKVLWVNTIGTRTPELSLHTLRRAAGKICSWAMPTSGAVRPGEDNPRVLNPRMWPWFTTSFDRWLNRRLLVRQLAGPLKMLPEPPVAITTVPIVADLIPDLQVRRWVYYCVDDFSTWPGLDQKTMAMMESRLLKSAHDIVAVSRTLQERLAGFGRQATLLTHGVDLDFWRRRAALTIPDLCALPRPLVLFFGVVDRRMDYAMVSALSAAMHSGTILLLGPSADPDERIAALSRVRRWPAVAYDALPGVAQAADVLMMPYADLPVTRAMQPLKLKEYLATDRPVVASDLPATRDWADCLDLAETAEQFASTVLMRITTGLPATQRECRTRLETEGWDEKAREFSEIIQGDPVTTAARPEYSVRQCLGTAGALLTQ